MNLLTGPLPERVEIDGVAWLINSDFRVGIRFELLMQDKTLTDEERVGQALMLYYPQIPSDLGAAMERLLWFYSCGRSEEAPAPDSGEAVKRRLNRTQRAYCFEQDAELILSAFWSCYGIDLNEVEGLHWWKFRALFTGLSAECELCKVMGYRTADTTGLSKKQKQHYERMKKLYALKNQTDVTAALTLAERDQSMKDYIARRFEEMGEING